jgi:hypothetical protein
MNRRGFLAAGGILGTGVMTPTILSLMQYQQANAQGKSREKFVGTWNLISTEFKRSDGVITPLLPPDTIGVIMYDANGRMAVQIMEAGRPKFASGDQTHGTPEEIKAAIGGYFAYFGDYIVVPEEAKVIHRTKGDILPNHEGEDQIRFFKFEKNFLYLSTPPVDLGGLTGTGTLKWQRDE